MEIKTREIERIERQGMGYKDMDKLDLTINDIYDNFKEQHQEYKLLIKEVCDYYPLATNNDFILWIEILRLLGLCEVTSGKDNFIFKIKRENIKKIPPSESIRRSRQSWNHKGYCLPTDKRILELRGKREIAIRRYFSQEKYKNKASFVK
jgi:hypothetical protein